METTSNSSTGLTSYTLYVTNLPLDLEKDGVKNIFLEYGHVTGVILIKGKNNTNQAYISYSKYNEAERAIDELNKKLPLMLNIQFKDKNLSKNKFDININLSNPIDDFRYKESALDSIQTTRRAIDVGRANCSAAFQSKTYTCDDELLYSVPSDSSTFNPYESAGQYCNTNLMYTRGTLQISKDGCRHISYGRGYTHYNLPEPHYNVATYIQSICEKREKGLYEYVSSDIENDTGNCKICLVPTAYRCQRCNITFYCSKPCQINDWPKHNLECQPIPALVKLQLNSTLAPNISENIISEPEELKEKTLRRSKSQISQAKLLKNTSLNQIPSDKIKQHQSTYQDVQEKTKLKNPTQSKYEKFRDKFMTTLWNNNDKADFIPKDTFITVIITTLLNEVECLVQKIDNEGEIEMLFINLQNHVESHTLVEPEENVLCILKHENLWYRATIISYRKNSNSYVYYHDFGTYGEVMVHKVCPINSFKNIPCYARRIRFTKANACKGIQEGGMISVKAINITKDGTIIVDAQPSVIKNNNCHTEEQISKCSIDNSSPTANNLREPKNYDDIAITNIGKLPTILEKLEVGESGLILFHAKLSQNEYNITLVPEKIINKFHSFLDEIKSHCLDQLDKNPNFSPKVGDLICGQSMEAKEWFRGVVLSTNPIKLAVIDEGRVFAPVVCTPMSSKYSSICSLGLVCQFSVNSKMPETKIETGTFQVVEISETLRDTALIQINIDNLVCIQNARLKKWIPKLEQKGIEFAILKSGDKVTIAHFSSQNLIYVLNQEPEQKEFTYRLEQNIAKASLNRQCLTDIPVVGQIVMSHYKVDSNYYRAIVTKVKDDKILVKYIDYGNEEITTIHKLFVLPDDLKKFPSSVSKIRLKNVKKDVPLNQDATNYFQELMAESAQLICTFDGHPFDDGVVLKTLQGENVNYKMNILITPTWEKDNNEQDTKIFYSYDLPMLKLGNVGDEAEAIVLSYFPDSADLILGPNDEVAVKAIQEDMLESITKYVQMTTNHYIPRDSELCIAKYKDMFYRAVCVDSSASPTTSRVFFIDYGNAACVEHTDIRVFTQDFAALGAFGIFCNITSMVPENKFNKKISQRINQLLSVFDIIKIKIVSLDEHDTPNIDIPAIREVLIKEKLI